MSTGGGSSSDDSQMLQLLLHFRCDLAPRDGAADSHEKRSELRNRSAAELRAILMRRAMRHGLPWHDAEDVVHDSLLQALTIPVERWAEPKAILPTISRRRVSDQLRRVRREREQLSGPAERTAAETWAACHRDVVDLWRSYQRVLKGADPKLVKAMEMRAEGYTYAEVALALRRAERMVPRYMASMQKRIRKARELPSL
jgi:DNA-directed RNA polymerase specialized sigma24 family protein